MKIRMIVDSTADTTQEVAARLTVVPLTICFGQQEYVHGVNLTNREFYEKLVESDVLPTTSQATPYAFEKVYQEAVDAGETVVVITLSQKLSGTYQSAVVAAAEFPGKVFEVEEVVPFNKKALKEVAKRYPKADVTARNFTMDTNALKKLSGIKDGGNRHIFAVTLHNGERVLIVTFQK